MNADSSTFYYVHVHKVVEMSSHMFCPHGNDTIDDCLICFLDEEKIRQPPFASTLLIPAGLIIGFMVLLLTLFMLINGGI